MMKTFKNALIILTIAALAGACGLRGPLYLPDEEPEGTPILEQDLSADTDGSDDVDKKEDGGGEFNPV